MSYVESYQPVGQSRDGVKRNYRKRLSHTILEQDAGLQFLTVFDTRGNGPESYGVSDFHLTSPYCGSGSRGVA
jgi:hypothetical protein